MGRHGGGSSGGISHAFRNGRRHGRGSAVIHSSVPFAGGYNRSYYHKGVYHSHYTNDKKFGTSLFRVICYFIQILFFFFGTLSVTQFTPDTPLIVFGEKVNGDLNRIVIQDTIDLLTPGEEERIKDLFSKVYAASGMPITLYTDDMEWQGKYNSIETYSEELYYAMGEEEDAMIILFTCNDNSDWVFDIYCGDDTIKCLSDTAFEKLVDNFQSGMAAQELIHALNHSLNSIMDDFAKTYIDSSTLYFVLILVCCCYVVKESVSSFLIEKNAYTYFKENPEALVDSPHSDAL